jgi:Fe-S oxidoreductase
VRRSRRNGGSSQVTDATVVVWPDTFTDAFRPWLGHDAVAVLEAIGERVAVPTAWACCGRPLYDTGMLDLARRWLTRALDILAPWLAAGVPVVVVEPSCLAAFRDELPGLLSDDPRAAKLASLARSPAEHLLASPRLSAALDARPAASGRVALHPHCHARADGATPADVALLRRLGYDVELIDGGCCGLAGSFGFDARHESLSRRIGEDHWLPRVRAAVDDDVTFITDGFSCVTQTSHLRGPVARSTIEVLCERFGVSGGPR